MPQAWQLQEAKNKFSVVVEDAIRRGPQLITRRGVETAVVLSWAEYRQLVARQQQLSTFFHESPLVEAALDLRRDTSDARAEPAL